MTKEAALYYLVFKTGIPVSVIIRKCKINNPPGFYTQKMAGINACHFIPYSARCLFFYSVDNFFVHGINPRRIKAQHFTIFIEQVFTEIPAWLLA